MSDLNEPIPALVLSAAKKLCNRRLIAPFLTRWTFRFVLLKRAYTREAIEKMVAESRFGTCEIDADGIGFDLRLARRK